LNTTHNYEVGCVPRGWFKFIELLFVTSLARVVGIFYLERCVAVWYNMVESSGEDCAYVKKSAAREHVIVRTLCRM
jgi:hypothetical protein